MDKKAKEGNQNSSVFQIMMFRQITIVGEKALGVSDVTWFCEISHWFVNVDRGYDKLRYVLEIQNKVPCRLWNKLTNNQRQQSKQSNTCLHFFFYFLTEKVCSIGFIYQFMLKM